MSFTQSLAAYFRYPKQVREAAKQMYEAVMRGHVFEIPLSLDKHDPAMQAAFLMQAQHPDAKLGVRQSRSLVVSHESRHNISPEVKVLFLKGGQMYDPMKNLSDVVDMLAGHERFLREQGLNPEEMVKEAKEAEAAEHAIEVSSAVGPAAVSPTDSVEKSVEAVQPTVTLPAATP